MKRSKSTSKTRKPPSDYFSLRKDCRACGGALESVLNLGLQEIISLGDKEKRSAPLELMKCRLCNLVQLRHTVDRDFLFRQYYYRSGATQTMRDHLKGVVEDVMKRVELEKGDVVVDIGSNDGTLLKCYPNKVMKVGFEPANIPVERIEGKMDWYVDPNFFSAEKYKRVMRGLENE